MYLQETPEQQALRSELRAYFAELLSPEVRAEIGFRGEGGEGWRRIVKQMGDGRLARHRLAEGVRRPGPSAHRPVHLLRRGAAGEGAGALRDPEHRRPDAHALRQRRAEGHLPAPDPRRRGQLRHRLHRARGRAPTSPSLQTRAVRDGDEYVINGNKIFTSGANDADWVWLACRTDPEAKKHQGISMILVPTDAAGLLLDADRHGRREPAPRPPTTTTCGSRSPTWWARRTAAGA